MSRRSPLGLRGLKCNRHIVEVDGKSRSPLGLRGLKYGTKRQSRPLLFVAALLGCVDWNSIKNRASTPTARRSPLGLRGLKYLPNIQISKCLLVAALLGCVDWNADNIICITLFFVAALLGCVDWNPFAQSINAVAFRVAALLGCVDWNCCKTFFQLFISVSQPSWAAWIEIMCTTCFRR